MCYFLDSATTHLVGNKLKKQILALFCDLFGLFLVANVGYHVFYLKYLNLSAFKTKAQCLSVFKTVFNGN